MPRLKYAEYRPREDAKSIIDQADSILRQYASEGYRLTLRQLFYQFVARDLLPNTDKSYNKLGDIISKARDAGLLDWSHIEDRGRYLRSKPHWEDPAHFVASVMPQFGMDLWEDQDRRVEVWVEKESLIDIVERACLPLDVPCFANKGYVSSSAIWDAGYNRFRNYGLNGQDVTVLHLGDHDPSGIDMTRDIRDRLNLYSTLLVSDGEGARAVEIEVKRLALNMDQVEEYGPPPNPAKLTDVRAADYTAIYGFDSWELDALEPSVLVSIIEDAIYEVMDRQLFETRSFLQNSYRVQLERVADRWDDVVEFLQE